MADSALDDAPVMEEEITEPEVPEESREDQLCEAVRKNQQDLATELVKDANINKTNSASVSPLYLAIDNHNVAMVRLLLSSGADVNLLSYCHKYCTYETPVVTATRLQNSEIMDVILRHGCLMEGATYSPNSKTALQWAASNGNLAMADRLLAHGADVNWIGMFLHTALHYATIADKPDMVQWLLDKGAEIDPNGDGRTPLHIACVRGNLKIVSKLTQHGCHCDAKDNFNFTPLSLACLRGHLSIARHLVEVCPAGIDLDEGLHKASESGHLGVVEFLLKQGADVNSTNSVGENALAISAKGQFATIQILLEHGANINRVDNRGYTSLQHALMRDQCATAALLIQHGARLNNTASTTESPLSIAYTMSNPSLVRYLLQAGCQVTQEAWFVPAVIKERIQEADFQIPGSMRFCPDNGRQKRAWEWVSGTFGRTRSLRQVCRMAVREQLSVATGGASILSRISDLPLPPAIMTYLTLSDIADEVE